MPRQGLPDYVLSLPERVVRSAAALAGGLVREVGIVALPPRLRRTNLYRNLVEAGLRLVIEEVGQVEGVYPPRDQLASESVLRYAAGYFRRFTSAKLAKEFPAPSSGASKPSLWKPAGPTSRLSFPPMPPSPRRPLLCPKKFLPGMPAGIY
jgi:hypothetical protein